MSGLSVPRVGSGAGWQQGLGSVPGAVGDRERADPSIAPPMHCLHEPWRSRVIPESVPERVNTHHQDPITDHGPGPDRLKEGRFGQQLTGMFYQQTQDSKGFGPEGQPLWTTPQTHGGEVQTHRWRESG